MQLHVFVTFASCGNVKCQEVVRFRCKRSNGNVSKRHETANGNTGYPSCFRIGFTCFCDVSVYGFLEFRPVLMVNTSMTLKTIFLGEQLFCLSLKGELRLYKSSKQC